MPQVAAHRTAVGRKVVARQSAHPPGLAILKELLQARPIDGARVIVIDSGPLAREQVRAIQIKIVQREPRSLFPENFLQPVCQPALASAAAAYNRHQAWCGDGSHATFASCAWDNTSVNVFSKAVM